MHKPAAHGSRASRLAWCPQCETMVLSLQSFARVKRHHPTLDAVIRVRAANLHKQLSRKGTWSNLPGGRSRSRKGGAMSKVEAAQKVQALARGRNARRLVSDGATQRLSAAGGRPRRLTAARAVP